MEFLDLAAAGLDEWQDPATAAAASVDSQKKLQAMLIATRLLLQRRLHRCQVRADERRIKQDLDEIKTTGYMLAALLKSEAVA